MNTQNKRERLIDSAALLFYTSGLSATSLADIAKHADIPIGNVYYYFKTKEELAIAAVQRRREQFTAAYAALEESTVDPRERLKESLRYFENMREDYARFGCPVGKLIMDADMDKDMIVQAAAGVLADFIAWAERQFERLGHRDNAKRYATSLVAGIEGAALMAKTTRDPNVVSDEINRMVQWIDNLPNLKIPLGKMGIKAAPAEISDAA